MLDGRDVKVDEPYQNGFFVGPTILDHVRPGMTVGDREIFGPVTLIKRVKDFDEGLAVMNANPFANGSVIFTQSGYYARKFEFLTDGGMVGINVGIPVPTAYFPSPATRIPSSEICMYSAKTASGSIPVRKPLRSTGMTRLPVRKP